MKNYEISITILRMNKNETVEVKNTAKIVLDNSVKFSEILDFMSSAKTIWKKAMNAKKKGFYYKMEIIESVYDGWMKKEFNRWHCTSEDQDDEGIYLKPDTRYTDENHDMYLTKDTLKDLATYLI